MRRRKPAPRRLVHMDTGARINAVSGRALCGRGVSLFDLTSDPAEITCEECCELELPLTIGDLGSALQTGSVPPQRSWIGLPP